MKVESTFHPDLVIEVTMGVGPQGPKGDAYILTEDDKLEIGHMYDALKDAAAVQGDAILSTKGVL